MDWRARGRYTAVRTNFDKEHLQRKKKSKTESKCVNSNIVIYLEWNTYNYSERIEAAAFHV